MIHSHHRRDTELRWRTQLCPAFCLPSSTASKTSSLETCLRSTIFTAGNILHRISICLMYTKVRRYKIIMLVGSSISTELFISSDCPVENCATVYIQHKYILVCLVLFSYLFKSISWPLTFLGFQDFPPGPWRVPGNSWKCGSLLSGKGKT